MPDELVSLTPLNDLDPSIDSYRPYSERLDRIFRNPDLRNIGIIGSRGSGKSSILHTYNKKRNAGKFLFVSLIDFEDILKKKQPNSSASEQVKQCLEYSILCQILARCRPQKLQGSSLRGIPGARPKFIFLSFLLAAMTALIFGLIFEDRAGLFLREIAGWPPERLICVHAHLYLVLGIMLSVLTFILLRLYLPTIRLKTLSLKLEKAEASMEMEAGKYCLDLYKFEIIHILNELAKDIDYTVVFEDMERLDQDICIDIMMKLRELNCMLQANRTMSGAPPIRFLYVLSDDVFEAEARTKFFDIILPVIPALNAVNFDTQIFRLLCYNDICISRERLRPLLDILRTDFMDFRMVRSLISEFLFFRNIYDDNTCCDDRRPDIEGTYLDLLALSACRVLFPKEFSEVLRTCQLPGSQGNHKLQHFLFRLQSGRFLNKDIFVKLCNSDAKRLAQQKKILREGTPAVKVQLLGLLSKTKEYACDQLILDDNLLFSEQNREVVYALGKYLFPLDGWFERGGENFDPEKIKKDGMPRDHERNVENFRRLVENLNDLTQEEVPLAVTNLLIVLHDCRDRARAEDLEIVLSLFDRERFPKIPEFAEILERKLLNANFKNAPPGFDHNGENRLNWCDVWARVCASDLLICLGGDIAKVNKNILRKKFGTSTFETLISKRTR